jgi:hypothetical protein
LLVPKAEMAHWLMIATTLGKRKQGPKSGEKKQFHQGQDFIHIHFTGTVTVEPPGERLAWALHAIVESKKWAHNSC